MILCYGYESKAIALGLVNERYDFRLLYSIHFSYYRILLNLNLILILSLLVLQSYNCVGFYMDSSRCLANQSRFAAGWTIRRASRQNQTA